MSARTRLASKMLLSAQSKSTDQSMIFPGGVIERLETRVLLSQVATFAAGVVPYPRAINSFTFGKANADALPDVFSQYKDVNTRTYMEAILLNASGGGARSDVELTVPDGILRTGDADGDGKLDVFVGSATFDLVYEYDGDGAGKYTYFATKGSLPGTLGDFTTADMTGDGRSDLIVVGTSGIYIYPATDTGWGSAIYSEPTVGWFPMINAVDLNGDGRRDLIGANDDFQTPMQLMTNLRNANGTWTGLKTSSLTDVPVQQRFGDFNGDGKMDVAVLEVKPGNTQNSASVDIMLGQGNGFFGLYKNYPINSNPAGLAVGDFDLDGRVDFAVGINHIGDPNPGSYAVYRNLGSSYGFAPTYGGTAARVDQLDTADFNNDGKPDLIGRDVSTKFATVFLNTSVKKNFVRGTIFNDSNRNRARDSGEATLSGRVVYVDANRNDVLDAGEESTVSRSDGTYELMMPDGTFDIVQQVPQYWNQSYPYYVPTGTFVFSYRVTLSGGAAKSGNDFGSYDNGNVYGTAWDDANANQYTDSWETVLSGRTVYIDSNNNGIKDSGETSTTTASDGYWHFRLGAGTYKIRQVIPAGWIDQTGIWSVTVTSTGAYYKGFRSTRPTSISGRVYNDDAQNSRYDAASDVGIGGLTVFLDTDNDGVLDTGEKSTTTSTSATASIKGTYSFTNLTPQQAAWNVRLVKTTGYLQISPLTSDGKQAGVGTGAPFVTPAYGGSGTSYTDFGLIKPAFITGFVFADADTDGVADSTETGIANVAIYLDYNGNGVGDIGEPVGITDALGNYSITSARAGSMSVIASRTSGFNATVPVTSRRTVTLVAGSTVRNQNFGQVQGPFSNAPYQPPVNIATSQNPVSLASGDFNKDGKQDFIVAANFGSAGIFLGQGNGLFTKGTSFFTGSATRFMVATDLNADGKVDLVCANQDDSGVGVLLGNGNGTFSAVKIYDAIASTYGVAVADFTGDGKPDIVAAGQGESRFAFLKNNGNGTFASATFVTSEYGSRSIAAGDINKDGKQDVVIASPSDSQSFDGSICYIPGNGNGTFGALTRITAGITQPNFVTLADVNNDTKLDLIYINEPSDAVGVKLGNGNGTFAASKFFVTGSTPAQMAVIDVDRDGRLDLVVACRSDGTSEISGGISVLRGRGDGTFVDQVVATAHTSPTAVAIGDFNSDSKLDIVTANFFSADVSLLKNGTSGNYGSISGLVWSDTDFDGTKDATEVGLSGLTVYSDVNNNSTLDAGEANVVTAASGSYTLTGLTAGTYNLRVVSSPGLVQAFPINGAARSVTLTAGQAATSQNLGQAPTNLEGGTVLDNTSGIPTGAWATSTKIAGSFGASYLHDGNNTKGSKSFRFAPTLAFDGYYEVFARWPADTDRATNVPIDIINANGTRTVTVNQQLNNNVWMSLGTYFFKRNGGAVLIRTTGTSGYVIADAVKFVTVPTPTTITKDNSDATGVKITGAWTTATTPTGFQGSNYLQDGNAGKGTKSVAYSAGTITAGVYEIFAKWTSASTRATNARFDILTTTGTTTILKNQQSSGGVWVSLGYFSLDALSALVTVRNDGTNGTVVADGIQFVKVA